MKRCNSLITSLLLGVSMQLFMPGMEVLSVSGIASTTELGSEDANAIGLSFGKNLGALDGYIDLLYGEENDYDDNAPSSDDIEEKYNLDDETSSYRRKFIKGFKDGYEIGYEESWRHWNLKDNKDGFESGKQQGFIFGQLNGEIAGRTDLYNGDMSNWKRAIPSHYLLNSQYQLSNDTQDYREAFIMGYEQAFEEAYTKAYRETNRENKEITTKNAMLHGQEIGNKEGDVYGKMDYLSGKSNNWATTILSDQQIISKYHLSQEDMAYQQSFIVGYKNSFKESYADAFRDSNMERAQGNVDYTLTDMTGGIISSGDGRAQLEVNEGTIYKQSMIGIENLGTNHRTSLEGVSPRYHVDIVNETNSLKLHKPIRLSFSYIGDKHASIYQYKNNQWLYVPSVTQNNRVTMVIDQDIYYGGSYGVFIDENTVTFEDIYDHWAQTEIVTFVKRHYVSGYGDGTFRPLKPVSRGEFVKILDRIYKWPSNSSATTRSHFADDATLGVFRDSILKAVDQGIIKGYSDHTFRPNLPVTYQEIEWMIQRLPGHHGFKWQSIAQAMLDQKGIRSKSMDDMNNKISRAEVVYLMYRLQQ